MKRIAYVAASAATLAGCALPASTVSSGSVRPTLRLNGAPAGSELVLDGRSIGPADRYDGSKAVLAIEEGSHLVEVRQGAAALVSKRVFAAAGESVTIDVAAGAQP
jgi:hypothetical protein